MEALKMSRGEPVIPTIWVAPDQVSNGRHARDGRRQRTTEELS
jgi:hypothetical protein